jgi:hypothetical protein
MAVAAAAADHGDGVVPGLGKQTLRPVHSAVAPPDQLRKMKDRAETDAKQVIGSLNNLIPARDSDMPSNLALCIAQAVATLFGRT